MFDKSNIIDLQEIHKKLNPSETREEIKFKKEVMNTVVERFGLHGFFSGQIAPKPNGIVLDYNVEEVKKELGGEF